MTERHGNDDLLTSREVAVMFGVGLQTVIRWEKNGKLRAIRTPGGRVRFYRREVEQAVAQALAEGPE